MLSRWGCAVSILLAACGDDPAGSLDAPRADAAVDGAVDASPDGPLVTECPALGEHWARKIDGITGRVITSAVASGPANEVVAVGGVDGTVDFCAGPITDPDEDEEDFFVAKYSSTGALAWARRFGVDGRSRAYAVAIDSTGATWAVGSCDGRVDFGTGETTGTQSSYSDACVVRIAADGTTTFGARIVADNIQTATQLAVDSAGNAYLAGQVYGSLDFGGGPVGPGANQSDIYLVSFSPEGTYRFGRSFAGTGFDAPAGLEIAANGDVVLAGYMSGTIDFGLGPQTSNLGQDDLFVARFENDLDPVWSKVFGSSADDVLSDLAIAPDGAIAITGAFGTSISIAGGTPLTATEYAMYVARIDSAGTHLSSRAYAAEFAEYPNGLAFGSTGRIVIAGIHQSAVDFGGGGLVVEPCGSSYCTDVFLASFDGDHVFRAAQSYGDGESQNLFGLAIDATDARLVGGSYRGVLDLGVGMLADGDSLDGFVARLPPAP